MQLKNNLNKGDSNLMHKKGLTTLFLTTCLVFMLATSALAADFSDVQGHWAEKQIKEWADKGLAGGYSDGSFKPNGKVTRAEFVTLVNRAFGIEGKTSSTTFTDVKPEKWYSGDVYAAAAAGYTGGYDDGTFRPGKTISRQEVASILVRLLDLEPAVESIKIFKDAGSFPQWSRGSIGAAVTSGLMGGFPDNMFQAQRGITRAEAVVSLDRALAYGPGTTPAEQPVNNPLSKTGVRGKVISNGKAVPNAGIKVFAADGFEVLAEIATGSDGTYILELEPGEYGLTASTDKEVAYQSNVKIAKDETSVVNLTLQPAAIIEGILQDENGKGIENALVSFTTNPTFNCYTGNNGEYKIPVLPDRTYTVRARSEGENDPVEVTSDLQVGSAGRQEVDVFEMPSGETPPSVGRGGPVGAPEDDTKPELVSATISVDSNTYPIEIRDGRKGEIDIPQGEMINGGTVTASEDATLNLSLSSVPEELRDLVSDLISTPQDLEGNEPTAVEAIDLIVSIGVSIADMKELFGVNSMTLTGTLTDNSGNATDVSLTVNFS